MSDTHDAPFQEWNEGLEESIQQHRRSRKGLLLLLALIVAGAAILLFIYFQARVFQEARLESTLQTSASAGGQYVRFRSQILRCTPEGICCLDENAKELWNFTLELTDPLLVIQGDYGAIGSAMGKTICIFDKEGLCGIVTLNDPLLNLTVSGKGLVAAVLDKGETSRIQFYDNRGKTVDIELSLEMSLSGYPLDLALSPGGESLAVATTNIENGIICTRLSFYNFSVGRGQANRLVGYFRYEDMIMPQIEFISESEVLAVGTDRLLFYSLDDELRPALAAEKMMTSVQAVTTGSSRVAVVAQPFDERENFLILYSGSGSILHKEAIQENCDRLLLDGRYLLLQTPSGLTVREASGGKLRFRGTLETGGRDLFVLNRRSLLQWDGRSLHRYSLR